MRWIGQVVMVATALMVPVSPQAADWWLVAGGPGDDALFFADAESVAWHEGHATVRVERMEKSGRATETVAHVQCSAPRMPQDEAPLRRFVCSTEDERMHLGIMLGDKTPGQTARMIFAMSTGNSRL